LLLADGNPSTDGEEPARERTVFAVAKRRARKLTAYQINDRHLGMDDLSGQIRDGGIHGVR
jgi:hypothetical protein